MSYTLIDCLLNKDVSYTPIWLMRQAGRYLPEYRKIREKAGSFLNLCKNPELATEVTIQPLKRFNLDAAIMFSDILVVPEAMGLELNFIENEGPKFNNYINNHNDINKLNSNDITLENLAYVFKTIKNIKSELDIFRPLLGFSGSPFTLLCYMLEGGSSKNYLNVKRWLINSPEESHILLTKITDIVIMYLNQQIISGTDAIMLFDSWGGVLTEDLYREFSLPYLDKITKSLIKNYNNNEIPSIVFTKGGGLWLEYIQSLETNAIGIDWTINIGKARKTIKNKIIQGNLDPVILAVGDKIAIRKEVKKIINDYKINNQNNLNGHIFNLGHGILPITNPNNVEYLVELIHELTRR
jgi:uroporphyrinogen decarboxylase